MLEGPSFEKARRQGDQACKLVCGLPAAVVSSCRDVADAQAQGIADAGYSFLRLIMALANHGASLSIFRWKLLPKDHAYAHLLEDSLHRKENPRAYHCFQDEDMIGRWKKLCHGTQGSLMEYRLMARYLLRMGATAKR